MSNSFIATQTVAPAGATDLDAEKLAAAGPGGEDLYRERIQITGAILAEIARVQATPPVPADMGLVVRDINSSTSSVTSVAASATSVTLLAANTARLGATIYNDSVHNLFLKLGATASTTSFTTKLGAGDYYEVPFRWNGIIDGIWDNAGGSPAAARITELT